MKKYLVKWHQHHELQIEANSSEEALEEAFFSDPELSLIKQSLHSIECLPELVRINPKIGTRIQQKTLDCQCKLV